MTTKPYIQRTLSIIILPQGEPIFCERATTIAIADDAAGEYLRVIKCDDDIERGEICIDRDEWPAIREGINTMIAQIESHQIERGQA